MTSHRYIFSDYQSHSPILSCFLRLSKKDCYFGCKQSPLSRWTEKRGYSMSAPKMDISHSQLSIVVTDIKFASTNGSLVNLSLDWPLHITVVFAFSCPLRAIVVLRPLGDYGHLRFLCLLTRTYFTNLDNPI
jgi:hypothetical protein